MQRRFKKSTENDPYVVRPILDTSNNVNLVFIFSYFHSLVKTCCIGVAHPFFNNQTLRQYFKKIPGHVDIILKCDWSMKAITLRKPLT